MARQRYKTLAVLSLDKRIALPSSEPKFDMPMVNVTVKEKSTATLPCSVSSLGSYQIVWTDQVSTVLTLEDRRIIDDERISLERPYTRDWNLHIRDVRYSDQGIYNCQINTNPVRLKTINLIVLVPAQIIDHLSSSNMVVHEGDTVTLVCNVTGTPTPKVDWFRLVPAANGGVQKQKLGMSGEVLVIHNVTRYCGDSYECIAFNEVNPAASRIIEVSVQFPPEIYLPNRRIGQDVGKETILDCNVSGLPVPNTFWSKDGNIITSSKKYRLDVYPDEVLKTRFTLSLRVYNIEKSDFGAYTCTAENMKGTDEETMYLYEYVKKYPTTVTSTEAVQTTLSLFMPGKTPKQHSMYDGDEFKYDTVKPTPIGKDYSRYQGHGGQEHQHYPTTPYRKGKNIVSADGNGGRKLNNALWIITMTSCFGHLVLRIL
ncbi:limbic system-associated membrane protein-like [Physella acuta]|uniref:limbic system-associated membrane protein-like n=1 Tax=Physella acuta TaxID=109671 RepID=UPI0027DAC243|nr:limbic system-associated membrane protein-like [Physella acuta]